MNKYTLYTSLSLNRPIRFSHGYQRLVVTQRTITSFFANCRFCSRYVAPLVIYKPTHIKGVTLIVMGRPTVIRSIKLHNIQALLLTLWSTYISRYLIGIWTEKLHKIVHVISNICFLATVVLTLVIISCVFSLFLMKILSSNLERLLRIMIVPGVYILYIHQCIRSAEYFSGCDTMYTLPFYVQRS